MNHEQNRSKINCENLGAFMINMFLFQHLTTSNDENRNKILSQQLIEERFARQIFWIEKNNNMIIQGNFLGEEKTLQMFDQQKFNLQIYLLYIEFARFFLQDIEKKIKLADKHGGILSNRTIDLFLGRLEKIQKISNFCDYFAAIDYPIKSKAEFQKFLSKAKSLAIRQGYIPS